MNNEHAIMNIETMAHNVMTYRSYYASDKDQMGEVDDAAQNAETALLILADVMKRYDKKDEVVMTAQNAHDKKLVERINEAWNNERMSGNFGFILGAIVERDRDEAEEKLEHFPETFDETLAMAQSILENICDDADLQMILNFVGYYRINVEGWNV